MYTIGLDLGGTNSVFGVVDAEGNIICKTSIKTQEYKTAEDFVEAAVAALTEMTAKAGCTHDIKSMGIGAPNGNIKTGCIEFAPNIAWAHEGRVPLVSMFEKKLGIPVAMTNDANAAAVGEKTFGVAKDMDDFIVITLGTGVGSGIYCNGKLVYGADGNAGELGHLTIRRGGRTCGCGKKGCLEAYCSATGIARSAKEKMNKEMTSYEVAMAAENGDATAKEIFCEAGRMLGEACAEMMLFSSPEAFIFFGGLANADELLFAPIREAYEESVMPSFKSKAKFLKSALQGGDAAILGAASLARCAQLKVER